MPWAKSSVRLAVTWPPVLEPSVPRCSHTAPSDGWFHLNFPLTPDFLRYSRELQLSDSLFMCLSGEMIPDLVWHRHDSGRGSDIPRCYQLFMDENTCVGVGKHNWQVPVPRWSEMTQGLDALRKVRRISLSCVMPLSKGHSTGISGILSEAESQVPPPMCWVETCRLSRSQDIQAHVMRSTAPTHI